MKKRSVQENPDTDIKSRIDILFPIKGITKRKSLMCKQISRQRIARNYE